MSSSQTKRRWWIDLALRLFLGGFYIVAGATKFPDPGRFAEAVGNYRILPHETINMVAITLPGIEVVAGAFLILGIWLRPSAWLINAMTVVFIAAISSALWNGLNIECGCLGTVGGRNVGLFAIAEDLVLLACGLWIVWSRKSSAEIVPEPDLSVPAPNRG